MLRTVRYGLIAVALLAAYAAAALVTVLVIAWQVVTRTEPEVEIDAEPY